MFKLEEVTQAEDVPHATLRASVPLRPPPSSLSPVHANKMSMKVVRPSGSSLRGCVQRWEEQSTLGVLTDARRTRRHAHAAAPS